MRSQAQLKEEQKSALEKFSNSLFCAGSVKDHVYHGAELSSFASIRVQIEGGRVIVVADAAEVLAHVRQNRTDDDDDQACPVNLLHR